MINIVDIEGTASLVSFLGLGGGYYLLLSLAIITMFGIFLLIIFVFTGGVTIPFLMAKLKRRPIIAILRKDKRIVLGAVEYNQGMASTARHGEFMVQPESVYFWPTGVLGFMAYADYSTSLPIDFVKATNVMKENDISDYEQLEKLDKSIKRKDPTDQVKINLKDEYSIGDPLLSPAKMKKKRFGLF